MFQLKKRWWYVLSTVVILCLLAGIVATTYYITDQYLQTGPNQKLYAGTRKHVPMLNPHPKYFLTIVASGDQELLKELDLHFLMQYSSPKRECMESIPGTFGTASSNASLTVLQWPMARQV